MNPIPGHAALAGWGGLLEALDLDRLGGHGASANRNALSFMLAYWIGGKLNPRKAYYPCGVLLPACILLPCWS